MKRFFTIILLVGAMSFVSGCMWMHDGLPGEGHHGGGGPESDRGNDARGRHSH